MLALAGLITIFILFSKKLINHKLAIFVNAHGNLCFSFKEKLQDPTSRAAGIVEEYQNARLAALEAKQKKDRKSLEYFGDIIQRLKLEISSLGIVVTTIDLSCQNTPFHTSEVLLDLFLCRPIR